MAKTNITCKVNKGTLYIENLEKGVNVQLFNCKGELCNQCISTSESEEIKLTSPGTYVVVAQSINWTVTLKVIW